MTCNANKDVQKEKPMHVRFAHLDAEHVVEHGGNKVVVKEVLTAVALKRDQEGENGESCYLVTGWPQNLKCAGGLLAWAETATEEFRVGTMTLHPETH